MRKHSIELLALTLAAGRLVAQQPLVTQPLDSASVVRLHLARGGPVQVVLLAPFAPESTVVTYAPPPYRECGVPRAACQFRTPVTDVRAIEVPRGNRAGRGALIGAGVGGALGFALGLAVAGNETCVTYPSMGGCNGPSNIAVVSATTFVGAALGAALGALFGLGSPAWGPAP